MLFEIAATDSVGVFDVSAKFMGVAMEKVELIFQVGDISVLFFTSHLTEIARTSRAVQVARAVTKLF